MENIEPLLQIGPEIVNFLDNQGRSPFHLAIIGGKPKNVRKFLNGGFADAKEERFPGGRTPLHAAAENGHSEVCSLLLQWGANANEKDNLNISFKLSSPF